MNSETKDKEKYSCPECGSYVFYITTTEINTKLKYRCSKCGYSTEKNFQNLYELNNFEKNRLELLIKSTPEFNQ